MVETRTNAAERLAFIDQHLRIDWDALRAFCAHWGIVELALFGSVVRDDFGPESDVDVMVRFTPDARQTSWYYSEVIEGLEAIFSRPVDLMTTAQWPIENPFRRRSIERDLTVIYAA